MFDKRFKNYAPVPTVLQMEATECGAASLTMILAHYDTYIPLEDMRTDCGVSRDGVKASNILHAARLHGLKAKGYRMEPHHVLHSQMPCIVHWNFNHFLVLEGIKRGKVYLNDPASGKRVVSQEEFDAAFTGVVLEIEPSEEYKPEGEAPKLSSALRKRLRGSEKILTYVILAGLFLVIPGLVIPSFAKIFVDDILLGGRNDWLRALVWGMVITGIVQMLLTYWQSQYLLKMQTKIALTTSSKFIWHILRLPIEFFNQRSAGDLSDRMQSNDSVASFLSGELAKTVINCIMLVFYFALMMSYNVKLTLVALVIAGINIGYLKFASKKREDLNNKLQQDTGKMMGAAMGGLQIIETLKASGSEGDFFSKLMGAHAKKVSQQQVFGVQSSYLSALPLFLTALSDALVLIVGGLDVMDGIMTIGTLIAFQSLMSSFMKPVNELMNIGTRYQEMRADMNRLDDVLKYETDTVFDQEEPEDSLDNDEYHRRLEGYIDIEGLTFGYSPLEAPLIENFELHLKPGMRVALVGGSGSGKSTVSKLISGVNKPWSGTISFDSKNKDEIPRRVVSNSLAMVDQDISMFADTVENNLTLWDETMPEDIMIEATQDAEIYDSIIDKPGGYQYMMQEGGKNFSGGQRQRIEIARALINNPSILILDEATSALDPVTENSINKQIRERGCTCIIVAHRLSTIRDCDEIIVMNKGKIVERGTHDDLKEMNGEYAELIKTI